MNLRLLGLLPKNRGHLIPALYGYSSMGVPGLEIIGIGAQGRCLREKIIYLSRELGLKFPMKRYLISIEGHEGLEKKEKGELRNLELPIIILFWTLTGNLHLSHPENCLISGKIGLDGKIHAPLINSSFWVELGELMKKEKRRLTIIGPHLRSPNKYLRALSANDLVETIFGDSL